MEWDTPREHIGRRLGRLRREVADDARSDEQRDIAMMAAIVEGFATLEDYARFIVAQNVRIFEAVNSDTNLDALTERLKAADKRLDAATGD